MRFLVVCVCILISTCLADVGYYGPYPEPFYKVPYYKVPYYKGPYYKGIYKGPYYKGPIYKGPIYKGPVYDYADDDEFPYYAYGEKWPLKEEKEEKLIDYWNTFKEIFLQSYADLKKPYVVEKPVPVPVPVDRVRTVVKKYPVFIQPKPSLIVIRRYKHH